jgi:hypothetical protein
MTRGHISRRSLALATVTAIVVAALSLRAHAQTPEYDLFIQRSPADAGDVTPIIGTHRVLANSSVTLTANAQPGYQFAYWLGDVSDPSAERTTILVNEPKVVIAVFHREPAKRVQDQIGPGGGGGGFDTLAPTAIDLSAPGWSPAGGSARGDTRIVPVIVPVVIPEPATVALLTIGILALRRRPR